MNPTKAIDLLHKLAAQIEAAGFDDESDIDIAINCHSISCRDELRKWAALMGPGAELDADNHAIAVYPWKTPFACGSRVVAFFEPGLLGGEYREVVVDTAEGLAALHREVERRQPEVVGASA